jgi:hypothetical protein
MRRYGYDQPGDGLNQVSLKVYNRTLGDINIESFDSKPPTCNLMLHPVCFTQYTASPCCHLRQTTGHPFIQPACDHLPEGAEPTWRTVPSSATWDIDSIPSTTPLVLLRILWDVFFSAPTVSLANDEMELSTSSDLRILLHDVTRDFWPHRDN